MKESGHEVVGFDIGYFDDCNLTPIIEPELQHIFDIRDIEKKHLAGVDAVLHLAGLSNDPLGELDTSLTERINLEGTIRLAELSKSCGIERFVFASSQSIYGVSDVTREMDEYDSEKAPVTAYALSKWKAELELSKLNDNNFSVVSFRPSTVLSSPRLERYCLQ